MALTNITSNLISSDTILPVGVMYPIFIRSFFTTYPLVKILPSFIRKKKRKEKKVFSTPILSRVKKTILSLYIVIILYIFLAFYKTLDCYH